MVNSSLIARSRRSLLLAASMSAHSHSCGVHRLGPGLGLWAHRRLSPARASSGSSLSRLPSTNRLFSFPSAAALRAALPRRALARTLSRAAGHGRHLRYVSPGYCLP